MARGPKPAAGAIKSQKAAVRSTRKPKATTAGMVVAVADAKGAAPSWLTGDGLAIWKRMAPGLRAARLLQAPDEMAFARYCRNFAAWLKLRKALDKDGFTYDASTTTGGTLRRADPNFLIADRLERQLLAVEDRFGLNPAERQRIIAARAVHGTGGLFDQAPEKPAGATPPSEPAKPVDAPTGFLN